MSTATSTRAKIRNFITNKGQSASLYSFSSATKTQNAEGDTTVSDWGTATSIKVVSQNHYSLRRMLSRQGEESNESERIVFVRDDVTIAHRDKLTIGTQSYLVDEIKSYDNLEGINICKRVVLVIDENY